MKEIFKLLKEFFNQHKSLVISSIFFQVVYAILESIIIPMIIAGSFNNIQYPEIFKQKLIILVCVWVVIKGIGSVSLYYHKQIEPEISKFIVGTIVKSIFKKYEDNNELTNVSLIIDKIHLIKNNLHDFSYLLFTVFLPRFIVLIINCINFYTINSELATTIVLCVILQYFLISIGVTNCVTNTLDEYKNKDIMYEYIEDVLSNIQTVQCTSDAYDMELDIINEFAQNVKNKEQDTSHCISKKQYSSYVSNIAIFSFIIYTVYRLNKNKKITNEQTTTSILLVIGLFENMSDMSYYIPEFTHRYGILKTNEDFLKELVVVDNEDINIKLSKLNNYSIEIRNVSFKYPKTSNYILDDFSVTFPENKIITIFGQSGTGKSTFIKLIFRIETPESGSIRIGNKNIQYYTKSDIRRYIMYVDQNTNMLFNRSIIDNILYGKQYNQQQKQVLIERIKNVFDDYGLYSVFENLDKDKPRWSFLNQSVGKHGGKLSGGQKKIVFLLRIQLNDFAKIVILDEPSTGLDIQTRNIIIDFIEHIRRQSKTIIIISHDEQFKMISDIVLEFQNTQNPSILTYID